MLRTSKGMQITSQGELLRSKAQEILAGSDEFFQLANTLHKDIKGRIRIGIKADPGYLKIPGIVRSLYEQYPLLNLEVVTSSTGEILQWVEAGMLDCGFAFGRQNNRLLDFLFLSRVDLEIAIPLAYKDRLNKGRLEDIAALPWIFPTRMCPFLDEVAAFLNTNGIELANRIFTDDDITKYALIDQGLAVSVLERNEAKRLARKGKIFSWQRDEKFESTLPFIHLKSRSDDRLIRTVIGCLKDNWKTGTE